jgi:hypothetical protein
VSRALVLGGRGSAGTTWLIAGLADGGLDTAAADVVVGTSAEATAAVQIATGDPAAVHRDPGCRGAACSAAFPPLRFVVHLK